jgi:hypothetical protein
MRLGRREGPSADQLIALGRAFGFGGAERAYHSKRSRTGQQRTLACSFRCDCQAEIPGCKFTRKSRGLNLDQDPLLVRHGHVEGIHPARFRSREDLPLTKRGRAEALGGSYIPEPAAISMRCDAQRGTTRLGSLPRI